MILDFTGSVRQATHFVCKELLYPSVGSERPSWTGLGWFSSIVAEDVVDLDPNDPRSKVIIDYLAPMGIVAERQITFFIGSYPVAIVTMRGIRRRPGATPAVWSVAKVRYLRNMPTSGSADWAEREYAALTFSGAPGVSSPED